MLTGQEMSLLREVVPRLPSEAEQLRPTMPISSSHVSRDRQQWSSKIQFGLILRVALSHANSGYSAERLAVFTSSTTFERRHRPGSRHLKQAKKWPIPSRKPAIFFRLRFASTPALP